MYSVPVGFAASSLHARIFGTGSDIFDCTIDKLAIAFKECYLDPDSYDI